MLGSSKQKTCQCIQAFHAQAEKRRSFLSPQMTHQSRITRWMYARCASHRGKCVRRCLLGWKQISSICYYFATANVFRVPSTNSKMDALTTLECIWHSDPPQNAMTHEGPKVVEAKQLAACVSLAGCGRKDACEQQTEKAQCFSAYGACLTCILLSRTR